MISARAAARYNVRPLLNAPQEGLRDAVVRLGAGVDELTKLARFGSVEALAMQGLSAQQAQVLAAVVRGGGGEVVLSADAARAVVLAPLLTAGELGGTLSLRGGDLAELGDAISAVLMSRAVSPPPVQLRHHRLVFGERTLVMGIVNVTPDSFSGDGVGDDVSAAVALARRLADEGADIIDIGGESTRPNSQAVSADEEVARVLPVLRALDGALSVPLSIDTRKAAVARAAIAAGACLVNDVWGFRGDAEMAALVASEPEVGAVLMHNQHDTIYSDLAGDICSGLRSSLAVAEDAGISPERLIIDPGFGFAKTPAHNLELVRRLGELRGIGRPILVGPSRKSTIGILTGGAPPGERVEGGLALAAMCVANGAHLVRTHDVAETVRALRVADAVVYGTPAAVQDLPIPGPTG